MYQFLRMIGWIHSIGRIHRRSLWVLARVALVATSVAVSTTGIRASTATLAMATTLPTVRDTWLVQLLPI